MNLLYIESQLPRLLGAPSQEEWRVEIQTKEKDCPPGTTGCRAGWVGCQPWQGHLQRAQSFQLEWGAGMKSHGANIFSRSCSGSAVGPLVQGSQPRAWQSAQVTEGVLTAKRSPGQRALQTSGEGIRDTWEPETKPKTHQADL